MTENEARPNYAWLTFVADNAKTVCKTDASQLRHNGLFATLIAGLVPRLRPRAMRTDDRDELHRSRQALARAQRISNVGSFERDLITGKTEFSDQFLRMHGVEKDSPQACLAFIRTLVHPDDAERVEAYRRAGEQGVPQGPIDYRIIRPDGEIRVLHRECEVLFDGEKPVCLFGTLQDITKRKKAELEIARSRESLARAQRVASIGSFEHDLIANRAEWSDQLYRLYGLSPEDGPGGIELALAQIHPEDRGKVRGIIDQVNNGVPSAAVEFRIVRRDGAERVLHRQTDITFDEAGRPIRVFGTVQDVTERHLAERDVQRSRENLARAQRMAKIGSFDHDILTGKAEWSEEMYAILGIESSNAVPGHETLIRVIHPEDRQKFMEHRSKEIAGQATSVLEYRILAPDGSEKIVRRENAVVFDEQGRPVRRYGTLQDVTALRLAERRERELERKLLQSQKLEALGTLAGGIAHDLNNSLVPIMALSKISARRLEPGNPIRGNLQTIYDASVRARDLVSRVLAFSRNETTETCEVDLADVTAEALRFLDAIVPSTIRLETHLDSVPRIFANPTQIHQVVTNLVANAVQAIGDGIGTIAIDVRSVAGTAAFPDVCLSVSDTGVGIDEATRRRIFEPFFTTKPVGAGTGLGLSIIHGIVTSYGGRIDVSSAPGKGTRFDVYFPTSANEQVSARPAA